MPKNPLDPGDKGPIQEALEASIGGGSYDAVRPESLLGCSNCGVVFLKKKIESRTNPNALHDPRYSDVTCPVCLATHGWEHVQ